MHAYITVFLSTFLPYIAQAAAVAFGLVMIWAVHKVGAKFKIDATAGVDQLIWAGANKAVAYAEQWAATKAKVDPTTLPSGAQKMATALDVLKTLVDEKHLDKYVDADLQKVLESALHVTAPTPAQG